MADRLAHSEMAEELDKLVWSKATWLTEFRDGRGKRPEFEIETKRREHAVLQQAAADYRRAAQRKSA